MDSNEHRLSGKSVDQIVDEIEDEVARRRVLGDYQVGLEQQLEAFFNGMMSDLHERDLATQALTDAVLRINHIVRHFSVDVPTKSRIPGIGIIHRVFGRLAHRHTQAIATQTIQIGDALIDSLNEVVKLAERIYEHDDRHIARVLTSVQDQLAVVEHLSHLIRDLEARLRTVESTKKPTKK